MTMVGGMAVTVLVNGMETPAATITAMAVQCGGTKVDQYITANGLITKYRFATFNGNRTFRDFIRATDGALIVPYRGPTVRRPQNRVSPIEREAVYGTLAHPNPYNCNY